ncbi:MAG TPA: tyrosine-type recombinase/integrase [Ktedonobacteraceae bacterium]|nr:tyrosine-type recombinase/integrase [Ktedonobacteraceae bacterium]
MLKQHCLQQLEQRAKATDWVDNDLVFPNLKGGYLHPNHMGEAFRALLKEAGLPYMRFHDLRHSAATILLARGVHIKFVSELLERNDVVITLKTYGHLLPSMQGGAVDSWKDGFDGRGEESDGDSEGISILR